MPRIKEGSQELRLLRALQNAKGQWINGQVFLREMFLSQYHRAIWNLQHKKSRYGYEGEIEASSFTDEHGFKSYRLKVQTIVEEELTGLAGPARNPLQPPVWDVKGSPPEPVEKINQISMF